MKIFTFTLVLLTSLVSVTNASTEDLYIAPIQITMVSSDGIPLPQSAVQIQVRAQRWGIHTENNGSIFPTLGWYMTNIETRYDFANAQGVITTAPVDIRRLHSPYVTIFARYFDISSCYHRPRNGGANIRVGSDLFDPHTGYQLFDPHTPGCVYYGSSGFPSQMRCQIPVTFEKIQRAIAAKDQQCRSFR